jgi:hypothetical protein
MMMRVATLVVGACALMACGPGAKIDGKQGAAEALLAASQPTKAQADKSATPVDLTGGVTWNCPEGGSSKVTGAGISVGGGNVGTNFTLEYSGCGLAKSDVGVAVYNGKLTFGQNVTTSGSNVELAQTFKGKVLVQGAFDDFLDVDVRQEVKAGDLGTTGVGVTMKLVGRIATSEATFTFDEELTVVSGKITAKVEASR